MGKQEIILSTRMTDPKWSDIPNFTILKYYKIIITILHESNELARALINSVKEDSVLLVFSWAYT